MFKYARPILTICMLLMITGCGQESNSSENENSSTAAETTPQKTETQLVDHNIDPEIDIILGDENAPHEMIVYYSPGCIHCLVLYEKTFRKIKELYIDQGKLRYVMREIPAILPFKKDEDGGMTEYQNAIKNSTLMAINLRCSDYFSEDPTTYFNALDTAVKAVAQGVRFSKNTNWPYFNEKGIETVFFHLGRYGTLNQEQYQECVQDPLKKKFIDIFTRNGDFMANNLNVKSLPAYYLDGEHIDFEGAANLEALLMQTLQEKMN